MSRLRGLLAVVLVAVGMVGVGGSAEASDYLDHTFDGDGLSSNVTESVDVPTGVRVVDTWQMADGRTVVAGDNGALGSNCDVLKWWVGRFTADGQPDPTFGGGTGAVEFVPQGVSTCFTQTSDPLRMGAVAVQSTGKIVVGGGPSMTLVRLNVDGSPDPSFPKPFWPAARPSSGSPGCLPTDHLRGRRRDLGPGHRSRRRHGPRGGPGLAAGVQAGVPRRHSVGEQPSRLPVRRGSRDRGPRAVGHPAEHAAAGARAGAAVGRHTGRGVGDIAVLARQPRSAL